MECPLVNTKYMYDPSTAVHKLCPSVDEGFCGHLARNSIWEADVKFINFIVLRFIRLAYFSAQYPG